MRRFAMLLAAGAVTLVACAGNDPVDFTELAVFGDVAPGDTVALRADGTRVEYADRRAGRILSINIDDTNDTELIAEVAVSTDGEQRGLLGHTVINGRRFAAWTDPDSLDLVVGEVTSGAVDRIVWSGTRTQSKAIGGHLEALDGRIVLGLGSLTDWAADHGSGALVTLDPDGDALQEPTIVSDGWNNPFAFTILDDGTIWVADNAPDGSDLPVEERDGERIGRGSGDAADRGGLTEPPPQRASSAIVELADGRLGVCGFLDDEMWAYDVTDDDGGTIDRAGTIGPCLSGAVVLDDGTIVTASLDDDGTPALLVRRP